MPGKQAVILIDHGSRRREANANLDEMANLAASLLAMRVYPAHMDVCEPTLAQAVGQAVADGADHVVVCPYFLSVGRHGGEDIPAQAAQAAKGHPEVTVQVCDPLGVDLLLAELVARRVRPHLRGSAHRGGEPDATTPEEA